MRISSQLLLTFLLNAFWQILLVGALAALGSYVLRNSHARYRHWVWVGALCLAFAVPAITALRTVSDTVVPATSHSTAVTEELRPFSNAPAQSFSGTTSLVLPATF